VSFHPIAPSRAAEFGLTALVHHERVSSTMDLAHELARAGAAAGTLVIADQQTVGRGRNGRHWASAPEAGLWMTLIERPTDPQAVEVLALRLGLALAQALDALTVSPITLKWPNDLFVGDGKLAGILVEARWRDARLDWVAIGIGVNRRVPPEFPQAAAVRSGVPREALLLAAVPAMRAACRATGWLSSSERTAWEQRDRARGCQVVQPMEGVATGVRDDGALLVRAADGVTHAVRSGSLRLAGESGN